MLARASWFSFARAADASVDPAVVHDSSMNLLAAATNIDPNPAKAPSDVIVTEGSALVANAGPEGTIADIESDTTTGGQISTYLVQSGDTLSGIASKFGVTANTIRWANNIPKNGTVAPGTTLIILPVTGIQYTVAKGDTISSIAKKFSADAGDIASYNGLSSSDAVTAGSVLIIPGGEAPAASAAPVKKKTTTTKKTTSKIRQGGGLTSLESAGGAAVSGYFGNPVPGAILTQGVHGWNGVDLGAPAGTPIYAAAGGTVIVSRVGGWNGGYGNYVVIQHANGTQTLYSHLSSDSVSVGDKVSRGQLIGGVGRTGEATGNHLHFEVRGARNPFAGCAEMTHCSPQ